MENLNNGMQPPEVGDRLVGPQGRQVGTFMQTKPLTFPTPGPLGPVEDPQEDQTVILKRAWAEYENLKTSLDRRAEELNLAETMDQWERNEIVNRVLEDYRIDSATMTEWRTKNAEAIKLAMMVADAKKNSTTGELMSNVTYPMIALAVLQFSSRAYPEIVRGSQVVQYNVVGKDEDGTKKARAERLETFHNDQVLNRIPDWEDDEDLALCMVASAGVAIKKTAWNGQRKRPMSNLVMPNRFIINYYARSVEQARRTTEEIELYRNDIVARQNSGYFLKDFKIEDLGQPTGADTEKSDSSDIDLPHVFLEQHRWLDLDGDGYEEPYIVTVHRDTQRLVRIAARYDMEDVETTEDGSTIIHIEPTQHYTLRVLMRSPDGGIMGMGLGSLMLPLNESTNTAINQMFDAGARICEPSGFLGLGISLGRGQGGGAIVLKRNEWMPVNNTGEELRNNIVQVETGQVPEALFKLLELMIGAGEKISMVANNVAGDSPGANVPVGTTLARIEEGLKIYTAAFKRIFLSLKKEFQKIHRLNRLHLDEAEYVKVLNEPASKTEDFEPDSCDVLPIADPSAATDIQRSLRAEELKGFQGQGLNDLAIIKRRMELLRIENVEDLMQCQADPSADIEKQKAEAEIRVKDSQVRLNDATAAARDFGQKLDEVIVRLKTLEADHKHGMEKEKMAAGSIAGAGMPSKETVQGPFTGEEVKSDNLTGGV